MTDTHAHEGNTPPGPEITFGTEHTIPEAERAELARVNALLAKILGPELDRIHGTAAQQTWTAEDGWLIGYTTSRVEGGPHHGRFVTMTYKPTGAGARSGNAERWERTYVRAFATRKAAKARALALYRQHSPKWDAKHGRTR